MSEENAKPNALRRTGRSLLRQLTGAVVGGGLAVGIYYVYEAGAPVVTAWLAVPQDQYSVQRGPVTQQGLQEEEADRITKRAQFIVNTFGEEVEKPLPAKPVPSHWDMAAIAGRENRNGESWNGSWSQNVPVRQASSFSSSSSDQAPVPPSSAVAENGASQAEADTGDIRKDTQQPSSAPVPVAYAENDIVPAANRRALSGWTSRQEPAEITPVQNSSTLPRSGLGLWAAALFTLCGTAALQRRRILAFVREGKMW